MLVVRGHTAPIHRDRRGGRHGDEGGSGDQCTGRARVRRSRLPRSGTGTDQEVDFTAWAMQAFNGLMIFDKGLGDVLPNIAALLVYGIVCLMVAGRLFRFREA